MTISATVSERAGSGARPRLNAYDRILVVVDPTAGDTQPAIDKAARIAARAGATIELYICDVDQDVPESWTGPAGARQYREIRRQQHLNELQSIAAPLQARGLTVEFVCEWHAPLAEGIGHHVIRSRPDLVVKGTSRRQTVPPKKLTRTNWNLIRQVPASLLLAGSRPWQQTPCVAVAVDPCHTPEHTAALDDVLVDEGLDLAVTLDGLLEIYHVLQGPPHLPGEPVSSHQMEAAHAYARLGAQRLARRAGTAALRLTEGAVTDGLARLVKEYEPDVLVAGALARPRWLHSAAGGTAAHILERIDCDLLIVKPPGFVSPLLVTED
jgi:universal stress protein E